MHLEHIGIAVGDAVATVELYERLLGISPYKSELVESEGVRTVFLSAGGPKLELLEATREDSPIAKHIASRGQGLHHLAFEVEDVDAAHARLAAAGFRLLNPEPKPGADGKRIFFVHPKDSHGVLVELCASSQAPLAPEYAPAANGERLAYYLAGRADAPPLVLLHGALGSTESETRRLIPHLEAHFQTIAIDFAGHGRSSDFAAHDPIQLELFRDNLLTVLDHLGIESAHAFGFSLGAATALLLARTHRQRVGRLAVHGTNVQWDEKEAAIMAAALDPARMEAGSGQRAQRLAATHGEGWRELAQRMVRFTQSLPDRHFPDDELARIHTPVLVSHGDSDRSFRLDRALHLWRTLPQARLAVHPGLDHPLQRVDASGFARMLTRFFLEDRSE